MRLWIPCLALLSGCYQPEIAPGLPCSPDGACPDGQVCVPGANVCADPQEPASEADASSAPDAPVLGPDAMPASGNDSCTDVFPSPVANLARCDIPAPGPALILGAGEWTLSTDDLTLSGPDTPTMTATTLTQAGGPDLAVVVADGLTVADGASLKVSGSRPLVLLSATDISIEGTVDGSAELAVPGPGGNTDCETGAGRNGEVQSVTSNVTVDGGSGAGGGGFGGSGGIGAIVDQSNGQPSPGGGVEGNELLVPLRGGCPGGAGGRGGGSGGGGGGAVQLTAAGAITVAASGVIDVGGGGGGAAAATQDFESRGGGGGGSGGALLLQATQVSVAGTVVANGGSGACGKFYQSSVAGSDGSLTTSPAPGAEGTNVNSGPGGDGSAGAQLDGSGGLEGTSFVAEPTCTQYCFNFLAGGGGGGGGVGRIRVQGSAVDLSGLVSPSAQQ